MGRKVGTALIVAIGLIVTACGSSTAETTNQPTPASPLVSPSVVMSPEPKMVTTPTPTPSATATLPTRDSTGPGGYIFGSQGGYVASWGMAGRSS
jgi:hypothetical protein